MKFSSTRHGSLFLTTTRLESRSTNNFVGVATGFFFQYSQIGHGAQFIVTNKHVVENKEEVLAHFLEGSEYEPKLGNIIKYKIKNPDQKFILHEDYDLAILPMREINQYISKIKIPISHSFIRSHSIIRERVQIEDVYFIGYPDGLWDSYNYLPILRKGSTATLMSVDYGGKELFLIDANTIPGSSGSPVFIKIVDYDYDKDAEEIDSTERYRFAGILASRFKRRPKVGTREIPIPLSNQEDDLRTNINIGVVIKSIVLQNFIHSYLVSQNLITDWFGSY